MKPPADLPLEIVLVMEAFAGRLRMPAGEFWAIVYRQKPPPPDWGALWSEAFAGVASPAILTELRRSVNVTGNTEMEKSHRQAISESKRKKGDRFAVALAAAGCVSMADLAAKLGVTPAALSRYVNGNRKIPMKTAARIETLTDGKWPADRAHWKAIADNDA